MTPNKGVLTEMDAFAEAAQRLDQNYFQAQGFEDFGGALMRSGKIISELLAALRSSELPFHTAEEKPEAGRNLVIVEKHKGGTRLMHAHSFYDEWRVAFDGDSGVADLEDAEGYIYESDILAAFASWQGRRA